MPVSIKLRALRDQRIEPLLVSLTSDDDPSIQIHALLGLAELSEDGRLDPARVVAASPAARQATIALGLDSDRLHVEDITYLLEQGELTAETRLQLLTSLLEKGEHVDVSIVAATDTSHNPIVHARQAALLSSLGEPSDLLALSARGVEQPDDLAIQDSCFEAIIQLRRLPSEAGVAFAHACIDANLPAGLRRFAMLMLLEQDAPDVAELFADEFTRATRRRHQLDLALLLLMTQTPAPARSIAAFGDDESCGGEFETFKRQVGAALACSPPVPSAEFVNEGDFTVQMVNTSPLGAFGCTTEYEWILDGDEGSSLSTYEPQYAFESAGTHTVTLRAAGPGGENSTQVDIAVTRASDAGCNASVTGRASLGLGGLLGLVGLAGFVRRRS